eukprot:CAMPEP_0170278222 /NCGR_PEP_ID=MMETSP0116_2-20130129/39113_1 /TAXON_ID=400756 /ORGANISM="Durinskia baltica, Strain CSIRO CS-38" /LENGTH=176 /DNA_ID=CAMNT_0010529529 /DNA_START=1 /DNA_END=528 /DNA_ORIENTATION=-
MHPEQPPSGSSSDAEHSDEEDAAAMAAQPPAEGAYDDDVEPRQLDLEPGEPEGMPEVVIHAVGAPAGGVDVVVQPAGPQRPNYGARGGRRPAGRHEPAPHMWDLGEEDSIRKTFVHPRPAPDDEEVRNVQRVPQEEDALDEEGNEWLEQFTAAMRARALDEEAAGGEAEAGGRAHA